MVYPGNKIRQRRILLEKRLNLSSRFVINSSKKICSNLFSLFDFSLYKNVHIYLSKDNEVRTFPILERIWIDFPEINTYVPVVSGTQNLVHKKIDSTSILRKDRYGILIPEGGMYSTISTYDIIIIPVVGFDDLGSRIGMGGGYYDRFLDCHQVKSVIVGLAYALQRIGNLERNSHDVRMNYCISESKLYKF